MRKAENDRDRCVACGLCALRCPREAIEIRKGRYAFVDITKCVGCGLCEDACPVGCIKVKEYEVAGV